MDKTERKGILCALLGGISWGISGTCSQYLFSISRMDTLTITVFRLLGSGILLFLMNFLSDRKKTFQIFHHRKDTVKLFVFALFGLTFCQFCYLSTIKSSNAGTATVLQYSGLVFIFLVTALKAKALPKPLEILSLLLVMAGVFLVATHGRFSSLAITREALFYGILAGIALMLYTLLPGELPKKYGSTVVLGWAMLIGGIFLAVTTTVWDNYIDTNPKALLSVAFIVTVGTALAFGLYLEGVKCCGGKKASVLSTVEPIAATFSAALVLGTAFTGLDILGFVLTILGAVLLSVL